MKHVQLLVLLSAFTVFVGACDEPSISPGIEAAAAELAEVKGLDDYTVEALDASAMDLLGEEPRRGGRGPDAAGGGQGPEGPGEIAAERPDPQHARIQCTEYDDGTGLCQVCVVYSGGCRFVSDNCGGIGAEVCGG